MGRTVNTKARIALGAAGSLALVAGALALRAPTKPPVMAAFASQRWLDVSTAAQVGLLVAINRHFDTAFGYPKAAYYGDGRLAEPQFWTYHHTQARPHPTVVGRWAEPLDGAAQLELAAIKVACNNAIDAGTAPTWCTSLVAFPTTVASLDATWVPPNSGVDITWDAGAAPPDSFEGGTLSLTDAGSDAGLDATVEASVPGPVNAQP